nr:uncharacterized protein LOC107374019 isoform X2 [Nothobranchius furzeri]XP_054598008.1 uncharacterized protein LOC107374019 isoform X2 [Nothobranchius furzeri]XP_054598009.1 uncharacterized protein LOC107374019 isoform X2 [Nothobranchius furzeri]XP_054598010.1 uncharacterized protein LOC107374019 isoform X2 [Nothobranchius furzeri]
MLRSHTLGISATQLCNTLREQHSDAWMQRAIQYLGVCEQFLALGTTRGQIAPPPQMPPVPSPVWLLTVYGYDVLMRLDEFKARITSTFGSILKMDSTKKVTEEARRCRLWHSRLGYQRGQRARPGPHERPHLLRGLRGPVQDGGRTDEAVPIGRGTCPPAHLRGPAPQLIYVDRDCCRQDGVSKMAALFPERRPVPSTSRRS